VVSLAILFPTFTSAATIVVDFNSASDGVFLDSDYSEAGYTFDVLAGHYDIFGGGDGGNALNVSEHSHTPFL
jgi:hypothetical protein